MSERRFAGVVMAGVLAVGVLSGCGATSARSGAPPFSELPSPAPSSNGPAAGVLEYPAVQLTVRYPARLKGAKKQVVLAYAKFQVALSRAYTSGRVGPDLRRTTLPAARRMLVKQLDALRKTGQSSGETTIVVSKVQVSGNTSALALCSIVGVNHSPAVAVMVRTTPGGPLQVSTLGPDRTRPSC